MIAPPFTARCSIVQRAFKATTLAMCWRSGSGGASARSTRKRKVRAMADRPDFHVITGGPGSGTSTLIEALAAEGFAHKPEAERGRASGRGRGGHYCETWGVGVFFKKKKNKT